MNSRKVFIDIAMKYLLIFIINLLNVLPVFAIRPEKQYLNTPEKLGVDFEEIRVKTKDDIALNVWHLPAEAGGLPIVISQSDAGNMGYWLYLGMYLQAYGFDVWLYDYRGFGESGDFMMDTDQLFYSEFVEDLSTVVDYVYRRMSVAPVLMGISMGTIIVNEYMKNATIPITFLIYDGYVASPYKWVKKLAANGKSVRLPDGYKPAKYVNRHQDKLYIVGTADKYSVVEDIPNRHSRKTTVKMFDSDHISSFSQYPHEYVIEIIKFVMS